MPNPGSLTNQSEISLVIGGEKLTGWSGLQFINSINSGADAFSFSLPFDPTPDNVRRFAPMSIKNIQILLDGERILNGYIEISNFSSSADERTLTLQGRSATGTLIDVDAGPPFQYSNVTFNQIALRMYQEFDPNATVGAAFISTARQPIEAGKKLPEVSFEPGEKIYSVLSKLASGLGLWGAPTTTGRLEFRKFSKKDINPASIPSLIEGTSPVRSVSTASDLTKRFQRYMVIGTYEGEPDTQSEVLDGQSFGFARRGRQITALDQQTTDIEQAAKFARSKAVIESYQASAEVDGWHYNGQLWRAGNFVIVQAPGAFILSPTLLIITRVTMQIDESGGQFTALDFGIPEAFETEQILPDKLPYVITNDYSRGIK